ncbi:DNA repair protein RecO [Roseivivax sp. CAU 1761]
MEWREDGVLLSLRRHGETSAILDVFTESRGRHAGVLPGATSRRMAPVLQPGAELDLTWRARLEDQIGTFRAEPRRSRVALALHDPLALAGLNAVVTLLTFALPERSPYPRLHRASTALLDLLGEPDLWPLAYLRWERLLLEETGFGLDLETCAVTGTSEDLAYVSPRTGRAVSRAGAGDWADRLLPLPPALVGRGAGGDAEVLAGLAVTGHFLGHHLAQAQGGRPLPAARAAFLERLARRAGS